MKTYRTALTGLLAFGVSVGLQAPSFAAEKAAGLECTFIVDAASGKTLYREGICDQRVSPASTFKLPLALMGYDADILQNEHKPAWDYKQEFNAVKRDQKTVDPTIWEKDSVLWFSREITRRLGQDRFAEYMRNLRYGNEDVSGDASQDNGLTHSWLSSSLKISPEEQVGFMRRFLDGDLPVSGKARQMTKDIIPAFKAGSGWTVHGKTGSTALRNKKQQFDKNRSVGWFVGWAEQGDTKIVFARLEIGPKRSNERVGPRVRDEFLRDLPALRLRGEGT